MTSDMFAGVVRAFVAALGGYLVGQGLIDANTVATISGPVTIIAMAGWSVWSKKAK